MPVLRQRLVKEWEMAQILAKSCQSLQRLRRVGGGPPFLKLGGSVRYSLDSLDDYIKRQQLDRRQKAKK